MSVLSTILASLVALEFFYIMYLETLKTTSDETAKTFNIPKEELAKKNLNVAFKNLGIYNGVIGLGLLYGIYFSKNPVEIVSIFLVYIILVAIYGSITSDKKIIFKQGGLAIITLFTLLF